MNIDREEARRIAELARIRLQAAELDRMAADMTAILSYVDQLKAVDLEESQGEMTAEPAPLRDDEPHTHLDTGTVASNAPEWRNGFFVVPRVIGGE